MNMKVTTTDATRYMCFANTMLCERHHADECLDHCQGVVGGVITFTGLTDHQYMALEDAAERMGLPYDGTQQETISPHLESMMDVLLPEQEQELEYYMQESYESRHNGYGAEPVPTCPPGFFWNGRQCLREHSSPMMTIDAREGF